METLPAVIQYAPTATFVADVSEKFRGCAVLYRCDPPLKGYNFLDDADPPSYEYVVASSISNEWGRETYLFGADGTGRVLDWTELPGSMKDTLDHFVVFDSIGYAIVELVELNV